MKRTNFYYPEEMIARLKARSERTGISVSELIRRAIDAYLKLAERSDAKRSK